MMFKIGNSEKASKKRGSFGIEILYPGTTLPDGYLKDGLKAMFNHYDKYGFHGGNSLVLETILGRQPKTLKAYLIERLKTKST